MPQAARSRVHAVLAFLTAAALAGCGAPDPAPTSSPAETASPTTDTSVAPVAPPEALDVSADLEALEHEFEARVGVSAYDTGSGETVEYRSDERFGFASTIKVFAAGEFLRQVPDEERDARVTWTRNDVDRAGYSPVTSEHVDDGLTLAELAEAAVRQSDNAATNLVLDRIGGPAGLGTGLAQLGDRTTQVVNDEPALNRIDPTSTDDTTTPAAFTAALTALLHPENLPEDDRRILVDWMSGNATGDMLVRAGALEGWVVADKSGGAGAIRNDIAIVTPPGRDPIIITVLTTKKDPAAAYDDDLVARVAETVLATFA